MPTQPAFALAALTAAALLLDLGVALRPAPRSGPLDSWSLHIMGGASILEGASGSARRREGGPSRGSPGSLAFRDPPLACFEGLAPRALRRLPGIGEARALAVARAIWRGGGGPTDRRRRLSDVPGIGPGTARRVGAWIAGRGDPGLGAAPPREGSRGVSDSPSR